MVHQKNRRIPNLWKGSLVLSWSTIGPDAEAGVVIQCTGTCCVAYTIDNRPWQYRLLFPRLLVTILVPRSHSRDHVCAFAQSYAGKTQDHVRSNNKSYSLYVYQSSGLIHYKPGRRKIREYTIQVKVSDLRIRNTSKTLQGKKNWNHLHLLWPLMVFCFRWRERIHFDSIIVYIWLV